MLFLGDRWCRVADRAIRHLVASSDVPAEVIAEVGRYFDALGPPTGSDLTGERLLSVDVAIWVARRAPGGRWGRANLAGSYTWGEGTQTGRLMTLGGPSAWPAWSDVGLNLSVPGLPSLDWNVVLEEASAAHDAFEAAGRAPTAATRRAERERLGQKWERRLTPPTSVWARVGRSLSRAGSRGVRSVAVGEHHPCVLKDDFVGAGDGAAAASGSRAKAGRSTTTTWSACPIRSAGQAATRRSLPRHRDARETGGWRARRLEPLARTAAIDYGCVIRYGNRP